MEADGPPRLDELATDLLICIAARLDATSLGRLAQICKALATVANSNAAWQGHLARCGLRLPAARGARAALRAATTLEDASWASLTADGAGPGKLRHFVAFGCNDGKTIVVFGGNVDIEVRPHASPVCTNATWALDVASGRWTRAAESSVERPSPRCFNADGAGGGVLRDAADTEWLVVFGGLCQPGYRDNQTWLLGPLGDAPERWQWWEVQADGETHSEERPTARFHHAMLVASLPSPRIGAVFGALEQQLVVLGGDDKRVQPIWDACALSLAHVRLQPEPAWDVGGQRPPSELLGLTEVEWVPEWEWLEDGPGPRTRHGVAALGDMPGVVVVGGKGIDGEALSEVWLCVAEGVGARWDTLPDFPHPVSRAAVAVVRESVAVCGGDGATGSSPYPEIRRDVWLCPLKGGSAWVNVVPHDGPSRLPRATRCDGAATVVGGEVLLIFGGSFGGMLDHFGDDMGMNCWGLGEVLAMRLGPGGAAITRGRALTEGLPPPTADMLCRNQPVRVDGLVARPELNGRCGTYHEQGVRQQPTAERGPVRLDGDRASRQDEGLVGEGVIDVMVKFENMRLCHSDGGAPVHVVVCGGAAYGLQARFREGSGEAQRGFRRGEDGGELAVWRLDLA